MRAALFLLLCMGPVWAQVDDDRAEAERQLESGARLLEQGQPEKARVRYEMAQRLLPDDTRPLLGLALADAAGGKCSQALEEIDRYLAQEKQPDPRALTVLSKCPRQKSEPPPRVEPPPKVEKVEPPPAKKPKKKILFLGIEAGLNIPVTSATLHVDFLASLEFGVTVWPRGGLSVIFLGESLVSRAAITPGSSALSTIFTENFLFGVEERGFVWKKLSLFGTLAAGFAVDTFKGFLPAGILHGDVGLAWEIGPGEIRLRPVDFSFYIESATFGVSWRASVGYLFRF